MAFAGALANLSTYGRERSRDAAYAEGLGDPRAEAQGSPRRVPEDHPAEEIRLADFGALAAVASTAGAVPLVLGLDPLAVRTVALVVVHGRIGRRDRVVRICVGHRADLSVAGFSACTRAYGVTASRTTHIENRTSRTDLVRVAWKDHAAPFGWAWISLLLRGGPGAYPGHRDLFDGLRKEGVEHRPAVAMVVAHAYSLR